MTIEAAGLQKRYADKKQSVEALKGIDLSVPAGEVFGLLGPNGAGKTTTVRILATLLAPSAGRASVGGHDVVREASAVRSQIGYVSQAGGLDDTARGRDALRLQAGLQRLTGAGAKQRIDEVIDRLGLSEVIDRTPATYSGGQRRRLSLALGMVHRPAVLFLDEPTLGLDPQSRHELWDMLRELRTEGTTVLLTTHYLEEADALCDRLAIVDDGRIVTEGSPETLRRGVGGDVVTIAVPLDDVAAASRALAPEPYVSSVESDASVLRVYVEDGEAQLSALMHALHAAHVQIDSIRLSRPTLDDVFLQHAGRPLRETVAVA